MDEEQKTVETNVILLPGDPTILPEESPPEPPPETLPVPPPSFLRRAAQAVFFRVVPAALLTTAVLVYALLAVIALLAADITLPQLMRTMLGEFTGGADNVRYTETAAEADPSVPLSPDTAASPLRPVETAAPPETSPEPPNVFPFVRLDMSSTAPDSLGLTNETPYEVDLHALAAETDRAVPTFADLTSVHSEAAPLVLILHTHATESFADTSADNFRSTDNGKNIVSVGKTVADRLTENGIGVIHCTTQFDNPDFNMAYYNAALAIKTYLAENPSISYILDIHRDSVLADDSYAAPVTEHNGRPTAQMMFVVGTDHGGSGHTGWRDNLALAARLQKSLSAANPTLMRNINLRSASFNEQYTSGSLLLEIGSCASTLEEVHNAAELFAEQMIEEILG